MLAQWLAKHEMAVKIAAIFMNVSKFADEICEYNAYDAEVEERMYSATYWMPWHPECGLAHLCKYTGEVKMNPWNWSTYSPMVDTPAYKGYASSIGADMINHPVYISADRLVVLKDIYPITVDGITKWNYNM